MGLKGSDWAEAGHQRTYTRHSNLHTSYVCLDCSRLIVHGAKDDQINSEIESNTVTNSENVRLHSGTRGAE